MLDLRMDSSCAAGLKSGCQIARRVTEGWAGGNLYCPSCESRRIRPMPHNSQAVDFICPVCSSVFQLKAGRRWSEAKVPDAGYGAMMRALQSDSVPNLLVLQYTVDWRVRNLLIVPSFFFTPSSIEKRKPLSPTARRAGWIGCNILLSQIAEIGKIRLVRDGRVADAADVRDQYARIRPLATVAVERRGWSLDVLRLVQRAGRSIFELSDAYTLENELARLYPHNRNIRPKIRQQLQVLRDTGFIRFLGRGRYELIRGLVSPPN